MSNEFWRRCAVAAGKALLGMMLGLALYGCNGDQPVAGRLDNAPSIPSGGGGVTPPSTNPAGPFAIALPSQVFAKLRGVKQVSSLLTHDASDFVPGFSQRVKSATPSAIFSPAWADGYSAFDTVSYAIYRFDLTARQGKLGIHTLWTQGLADKKLLWIGASNWQKDRWDWGNGAPAGVFDTGTTGMGLYKHPATSEIYVAVVVLGQSSALLRKVWLTCSLRGDWWMSGREPGRRSCSLFKGPDYPVLKWEIPLNMDGCAYFVYNANGTIYTYGTPGLSFNSYGYSINSDGTTNWTNTFTPLAGESAASWGSPAVDDDGTVYYSISHVGLVALTPGGDEKWTALPPGVEGFSEPAIGPGGLIYAVGGAAVSTGVTHYSLCALNRDGSLNQEYELSNDPASMPAISANGEIYVSTHSSDSGKLYAFTPDGALKWLYVCDVPSMGWPSVGNNGVIYFIASNSVDKCRLYAVNSSGSLDWTCGLSYRDFEEGCAVSVGPDGTLYAQTGEYLQAVGADGALRWIYRTGWCAAKGPTVDAAGTVYICGGDERLYAINPDGTLKWWWVTQDPALDGSVTIAEDGTLYFFANHSLCAIGPGSRMEEHTISGYIKDGVGAGMAGVTVTVTGEEPVVTGAGGLWTKSGLPDGEYLVSPSKLGFEFSPGLSSVTVAGHDLGVAEFTGGPLAQAVWPVEGRTLTHTRRSPYVGPADATLKWRNVLEAGSGGEPVIGADGTVYVKSKWGAVALNPDDGAIIWQCDNLPWYGGHNAMAIGRDGSLYLNDGRVQALSPAGVFRWSYLVGGFTSPLITVDDTIIVGTGAGVSALSPQGLPVWRQDAYGGTGCLSAPAIGPDGAIYFANNWDTVYALNADGSTRWTAPADRGDINQTNQTTLVLSDDGTLYLGFGCVFYAFSTDGTEKWRQVFDSTTDLQAPAIAEDGTIYFGTSDVDDLDNSRLYAYSPDGTLKWTCFADGYAYTSAPTIDANGTIYIGLLGTLHAVNPDGTLKWAFDEPPADVYAPAIGADGTLYFCDAMGKAYGVGPGAG
jgi:outer membrane protein assembly factor BamB